MDDSQGIFDFFAQAFPNDLLPSVFRFMLAEWPNSPRPSENPLENRITNRFVAHLQDVMRKQELPRFKFICRPKLPDVESDSESGEIDIQVDSHSCHPDAYLVIECKRLNVETDGGFASQAGEYIGDGGMGCFLSGQYPSGGNVGAMLGYVMTRTIQEAMNSINGQLSAHQEILNLREPYMLGDSSFLPDEPHVKETWHTYKGNTLQIAHIFLQYDHTVL